MNATVKNYLAEIGSTGGKVGGKSRSPAKLAAVRLNVALAQAARRKKKKPAVTSDAPAGPAI